MKKRRAQLCLKRMRLVKSARSDLLIVIVSAKDIMLGVSNGKAGGQKCTSSISLRKCKRNTL